MAPGAARRLLDHHDIHAVHVHELGLGGAPDRVIADHARAHDLALVTENVRDFADEHDIVLLFVLKRNLTPGGGLAASLADVVADWIRRVPKPRPGPHWP